MRRVRPLAWLSLVLAFGQVVFGAIVRITGSGMGCGDHWPKCQGRWIPPLNRVDLIIEVSHRYIAATLTVSIVALILAAWWRRNEPGVGGRDGLLKPALLAGALVVTAAMVGAVTVWLELENKIVIVTHLSIAMSLLAVLVSMVARGGPIANARSRQEDDRRQTTETSRETARAAAIAAALGFLAVVLGAMTANVPGANTACAGFPLCRGGVLPSDPSQYLQFAHRLVAFALFLFVGWLGVVASKRGERRMAALARVVLSLLFVQIVIAATMIGLRLPPLWRSLHEAVGTLTWVALFAFAYLAGRRAVVSVPAPNEGTGTMAPAAGAGARA